MANLTFILQSFVTFFFFFLTVHADIVGWLESFLLTAGITLINNTQGNFDTQHVPWRLVINMARCQGDKFSTTWTLVVGRFGKCCNETRATNLLVDFRCATAW
jgi:hypothetical protein